MIMRNNQQMDVKDQYQLRDKSGNFVVLIEHCSRCSEPCLQQHPDMDDESITSMIADLKEMLEISAENDLIRREIEEENKYLKDMKSDETRPSNMPEIKLHKYTYKILRNAQLPREFYQYDKVQVPHKKHPKKVTTMLFDKCNGEFAYFPRPNSFEVYFNNQLIFSRLASKALPDVEQLAKQIVEATHELCEKPKETSFKLQSAQKILHRRAQSQTKSNVLLPKAGQSPSQGKAAADQQPRFKSFQSIIKAGEQMSPDIQSTAQQNPFSPKKQAASNLASYFSYQQSSFKVDSGGSQLEFYGLPQVKQAYFRKSLERFNHVVNHENDTKFNKLVTHRRQYNKYIKMMSSAKVSQEREKQKIAAQFEENITKKMRDFQVSKSRLETKESCAMESPPPSKRFFSFGKQRQNSLLTNPQLKQCHQQQQEPLTMRNTFCGGFTTQDNTSNQKFTQHVRIDRAYQLQIMIGKPSYKKINLKNTLPQTRIFRFQSSHPKELEILDEEKRQCVVELQSGQQFKPLVRFNRQDMEGRKQYVIFVFANGEKFQNILLNVEFKEMIQV